MDPNQQSQPNYDSPSSPSHNNYDQSQQQQQQPQYQQQQQQPQYQQQPQQQYQQQPQYVQAPQQTIVVVQQVAAAPTGPTRYQIEVTKGICTDVCSDTPSCCGSWCFSNFVLATISYRIGRGFCIPFCCPCYVDCCVFDELQNAMGVESEGILCLCLKTWFPCTACCTYTRHAVALHHWTLAGLPKHSTRIRVVNGVAMA